MQSIIQNVKEDLTVIKYIKNIIELPFPYIWLITITKMSSISVSPISHLSYILVTLTANLSDWPTGQYLLLTAKHFGKNGFLLHQNIG